MTRLMSRSRVGCAHQSREATASKWWAQPTLLMGLIGLLANSAAADPCGMVPPIYVQGDVPLTRVGAQKTYVFYKDGIETFVIRPGFQGKVEEFGMLIPFPSVPALRKVSDDIFPHIAKAIDPPEVVIDLRIPYLSLYSAAQNAPARAVFEDELQLKRDEVRVVKEEAVGMYEVAVLEAGSAQALNKWMDDHGYVYPKGMDAACNDYVDAGWCFVAVKTRVGAKAGVDPKPGQRTVNPKLPDGAQFDGHVQAMGFRFRVDELVVPMRLSAFNKGRLHNVVYLLTDKPSRIRSIPTEYVVRQITGEQLIKNVTDPLPLRIIGGTAKDIPAFQKQTLKQRRDPVPHNGAARDLFAADLLSVKFNRLSHPHEEREKELLRIGERLDLRGGELDTLHEEALKKEREHVVQTALNDLKGMTLSVIDGDFPRDLLASQNLKFSPYKMPAGRNSAESYDAKQMGPAGKQSGTLHLGPVSQVLRTDKGTSVALAELMTATNGGGFLARCSAVVICLLIGLAITVHRRKHGGRRLGLWLLAGASLGLLQFTPRLSAADDEPVVTALLSQLKLELMSESSNAGRIDRLVDVLVKQGPSAVPQLMDEVTNGDDFSTRGWAVVCLAEIGGEKSSRGLRAISYDPHQPMLVRTWAAAARVKMADSTEELLELANLTAQLPALNRPIGKKVLARLAEKGKSTSAADLLEMTLVVPQLQQALAPVILSRGAEPLVTTMVTAENQNVRRQAAAYVATLANQQDNGVAEAIVKAYRFDPQANSVPWAGGPLFVPGINWSQDKEQARKLVGHLVAWHLWCEENLRNAPQQRSALQTQIHNNLRSLQLAQAAGYQSPGFGEVGTDQWLLVWGRAVGKDQLEKLLRQQGVADQPRYQKILKQLP